MSTSMPGSKLPKGGLPKNRTAMYFGTGALAAAAAYYFYTTGRNPNVSQKQNNRTAEQAMAKVGHTIDSAVSDGKLRIEEGQQKLGETKDTAGKAVMSKIDNADAKIETEASKVKGGIKSWFGWK